MRFWVHFLDDILDLESSALDRQISVPGKVSGCVFHSSSSESEPKIEMDPVKAFSFQFPAPGDFYELDKRAVSCKSTLRLKVKCGS